MGGDDRDKALRALERAYTPASRRRRRRKPPPTREVVVLPTLERGPRPLLAAARTTRRRRLDPLGSQTRWRLAWRGVLRRDAVKVLVTVRANAVGAVKINAVAAGTGACFSQTLDQIDVINLLAPELRDAYISAFVTHATAPGPSLAASLLETLSYADGEFTFFPKHHPVPRTTTTTTTTKFTWIS